MSPTMETVTVVQDGVRSDVAVPPGVSVGQLLAALGQGAPVQGAARLPTGRAVSPLAIVGRDLPQASVVVVASPPAPRPGSLIVSDPATAGAVAPPRWAAALTILAVEVVALAVPAVAGRALLPGALRWLTVAVALAAAVVLATGAPARSAGWALGAPGLAGVAMVGVLPPTSPHALRAGVVVGLNLAFLAAVGLWLRRREGAAATACALWGLAAAAGCLVVLTGWPADRSAALGLAAASLAFCLAPRLALRLPEAELIDTPLLAVSAATVRLPVMAGPSRIVARRTRRTVAESQAVAETLTVGAALAAVAVAALARPLLTATLEGWCAFALACSAALALWLVPMTERSPRARVAPRAAAVGVAGLTLQGSGGLLPEAAALAVWAAGALVVVGLALYHAQRSKPFAPALGRTADVLRGLACLALCPAALVASGLFHRIWELAS